MSEFVEVRLIGGETQQVAWLKNNRFTVPKNILRNFSSIQKGNPRLLLSDNKCVAVSASFTDPEKAEIVSNIRTLRMFTETSPLSSKMPFSYQVVPPSLRSMIARAIGKMRNRDMYRWAAFPSFPLDLSSDALSDILSIKYDKIRPTAVLLTHDIDSPEGLKNLPLFLAEEETVGARSTNFVVPCGWKIDHGLLSDVRQRGHEIGIHGFDHSNRTAFMNASSIEERVEKMRDFIGRYEVAGYRAPSLLRTRALLRTLSKSFRYDSSIPTSGGPFPVPNNGCASARIFEVEGIREIPLSMPRDGTLLFLGMRPEQIASLWIECADRISLSGGVIVLLTHCERRFSGSNGMLNVYRRILRHFTSDKRFVTRTCKDLL